MMIPKYPAIYNSFTPKETAAAENLGKVLAQFQEDDPWDYDYSALRATQLLAFNERLSECREEIPAVRQRVDELGIESVESVDEIIPMLFSPTMYKSYPESFVTKGRWANLLKWLDRMSAQRLTERVDVSGVTNIDEFIDRCREAGCYVVTTSGTSGKFSLMPESRIDYERTCEMWTRAFGAMWGLDGSTRRPLFYAGHRTGAHRGQVFVDAMEHVFSDPDKMSVLFPDRLLATEVSRNAVLNTALANGKASPSDLTEARRLRADSQVRAEAAFDDFIDNLEKWQGEPIYMWGQLFGFYSIMKRAKERGISLNLDPSGAVIMAGGLKNNHVPDGYLEEMRNFYKMRVISGYAQSEVLGFYVECAHGRWHAPPTVLMLLLDESGESLVPETTGVAEGILAAFDFAAQGRWGGVISSDWVSVDFSPCECGRRSPSLISCRRYTAPEAEAGDKLDCQGRIEMYIRGVVDEPADLG